MFVARHPAATTMRGDGDGYNPCNMTFYNVAGGGEVIQGVFKDDGRPVATPRRPDIPFTMILPPNFGGWHALNARNFYALKAGQSPVVIDMRR